MVSFQRYKDSSWKDLRFEECSEIVVLFFWNWWKTIFTFSWWNTKKWKSQETCWYFYSSSTIMLTTLRNPRMSRRDTSIVTSPKATFPSMQPLLSVRSVPFYKMTKTTTFHDDLFFNLNYFWVNTWLESVCSSGYPWSSLFG